MANTKGGLGTKGFNALFNDNEENVKVDIADDIQAQEIDITLIDRNPNQPRKTFDEDSLREMSTSIATYGVFATSSSRKNGRRKIPHHRRRASFQSKFACRAQKSACNHS